MLEDLSLALLRKFPIKFVAAPKIHIIYNFRRKKIVVELARNWDSPRKIKRNRGKLTWWRFQAKVRVKVDKNLPLKALLSGNIDLFFIYSTQISCRSCYCRPSCPNIPWYVSSHTLVLLKPFFTLNLLQVWPFIRIFVQNFPHNFLESLWKRTWKLTLTINYLLVCYIFIFGLKRSPSSCKFIHQDTQSPNINSLIILTTLNDFRWHIISSPTKSLSFTK